MRVKRPRCLQAGDELKWVAKCKEGDIVCIAASNSQLLAIAVTEKGLKPQMRAGGGSRVINLICWCRSAGLCP